MKRVIALLLVLLAVALPLVACTGDEENKNNTGSETTALDTTFPWGDEEIVLPDEEL